MRSSWNQWCSSHPCQLRTPSTFASPPLGTCPQILHCLLELQHLGSQLARSTCSRSRRFFINLAPGFPGRALPFVTWKPGSGSFGPITSRLPFTSSSTSFRLERQSRFFFTPKSPTALSKEKGPLSFLWLSSSFHNAPSLMANPIDSESRGLPFPGIQSLSRLTSRPPPLPLPITRRGSVATMEGALSMPPDRGTIIGRALWKVRRPLCCPQGLW